MKNLKRRAERLEREAALADCPVCGRPPALPDDFVEMLVVGDGPAPPDAVPLDGEEGLVAWDEGLAPRRCEACGGPIGFAFGTLYPAAPPTE